MNDSQNNLLETRAVNWMNSHLPALVSAVLLSALLIICKIDSWSSARPVIISSVCSFIPYWFVFGRTRFLFRYTICVLIHIGLSYVLKNYTERYEAFAYIPIIMFELLLFPLASLLSLSGFAIQKMQNLKGEFTQFSDTKSTIFQFSLRHLFQVTFYVAVSFALLQWFDIPVIELIMFPYHESESLPIVGIWILCFFCFLLIILARCFSFILMTLGLLGAVGMTTFYETSRRLEMLTNSILWEIVTWYALLYIQWLFIFCVIRLFGYRWTWQRPWRKNSIAQL